MLVSIDPQAISTTQDRKAHRCAGGWGWWWSMVTAGDSFENWWPFFTSRWMAPVLRTPCNKLPKSTGCRPGDSIIIVAYCGLLPCDEKWQLSCWIWAFRPLTSRYCKTSWCCLGLNIDRYCRLWSWVPKFWSTPKSASRSMGRGSGLPQARRMVLFTVSCFASPWGSDRDLRCFEVSCHILRILLVHVWKRPRIALRLNLL